MYELFTLSIFTLVIVFLNVYINSNFIATVEKFTNKSLKKENYTLFNKKINSLITFSQYLYNKTETMKNRIADGQNRSNKMQKKGHSQMKKLAASLNKKKILSYPEAQQKNMSTSSIQNSATKQKNSSNTLIPGLF